MALRLNNLGFARIKEANEQIQTITLTRTDKKTGKTISKEYAEVNQRIKAFRMVYPDGYIRTEIKYHENGTIIIQATCGCYTEEDTPILLGQGYAMEKEGTSFINQGSYIENCETSAVGRALGMAGFGIDTSVASADEVRNAEANEKISELKVRAMMESCKRDGIDTEKLCALYNIRSLYDMSEIQHSNAVNHWKEVKERCGI